MLNPMALLVSRDSSLADVVRGTMGATQGFHLAIAEDIDTACVQILSNLQTFVTLVHLDDKTNVAGLTRILQTSAMAGRPLVTIVIMEQANPEQALTLARLGVAECLSRPLDLSRLSYLIDVLTIGARHRIHRVPAQTPDSVEVQSLGDHPPFLFIAKGRMGRMIEQINRIAPFATTIMLGGETGTGKTHLAGAIHAISPRCGQPFVTISCGALAPNLVESEMFGHARGAFTSADVERTGKFAAVGRGTLFLDEIDSLPLELQSKLLRVVEQRVFEPVGSNKTTHLRARLIVASNRPLEQEVAAGRFRADLFYRLNVVAFEIPPLRERTELIPALAHAMLADMGERNGRRIERIAPDALHALLAHAWPGNIRELRNLIERAVALCHGHVLGLEDLPEFLQRPAAPPGASSASAGVKALPAVVCPTTDTALSGREAAPLTARATLAESKDQVERAVITEALLRNGHNRLRAAADLGISRMTLYKKLHKYGLVGGV
jgi:DNA-binding NtrC family response regulator